MLLLQWQADGVHLLHAKITLCVWNSASNESRTKIFALETLVIISKTKRCIADNRKIKNGYPFFTNNLWPSKYSLALLWIIQRLHLPLSVIVSLYRIHIPTDLTRHTDRIVLFEIFYHLTSHLPSVVNSVNSIYSS